MKRYIGYVERIDVLNNTCKVRVPNRDGFDDHFYTESGLLRMQIIKTPTDALDDADLPISLQGIRVGDIVYCLDSEEPNENLTIIGFYGGTY